jgi:4-amino-4-deoxy-L-arabinose transferase-like glycosyltransferase
VLWTDWLDWFLGLPEGAALQRLAGEILLGTLPWTLLLAVAVGQAGRAWRDPRVRFLLLAVLVPLALIALSRNPRARYLLPVYPAAALLVAWWIEARAPARDGWTRAAGWGSLALALVIASSPFWLRPAPRHFLPAETAVALGLGALVTVAGLCLAGALQAGRPARGLVAAALVVALVYAVGIRDYNRWNNRDWNFREVGALVARESRGPRAIGYLGRDFYQVDFYAGRHLTPIATPGELRRELADPARPVVVVRGRQWQEVADLALPPHRILGRRRAGPDEFIVLRGE